MEFAKMRRDRTTYSVNCGPMGCIVLIVAIVFMVIGCNQVFGF